MSFSFNAVVAASNGITVTASLVCCGAYLYKSVWQRLRARPLVASTLIIALTTLSFALQFIYPEIIQALQRDVEALQAGEWWRLITPLLVQPQGVVQFVFNMMFMVVMLPMAERLYGARLWLLYFVPGLVGQLANYAWLPNGGGGSSTAAFGVMGSLLVYVLWSRKTAPKQYPVFASLGILGAVLMIFTHDGHGPGLLTGAALAALICWFSPPEPIPIRLITPAIQEGH